MNTHVRKWLEIAPGLEDCVRVGYSLSGLSTAPHALDVFRSLQYFDPTDTRVVILGQDPYHTPGKASGLAFGYHPTYFEDPDSSLANILEEAGYTEEVRAEMTPIQRRELYSLEKWALQGVLLLNTCLTVEHHKPLSHAHLGYQVHVFEILKFLSRNTDSIFMLWGAEARRLGMELELGGDRILYASHPCRFSHSRMSEGRDGVIPSFTGSSCFSRANDMLAVLDLKQIAW